MDASRSIVSPERGILNAEAMLELHVYLRLAREWELRFETLYRTGALAKWYSAVGHEGITVAAATAIEAGDALFTMHRDSGAILRHYTDPQQLFPGLLSAAGFPERRSPQIDSRELLRRLACQMLGKADGFSGGVERSYHYGYFDEPAGMIHVGLISHLGAMAPVAVGAALAFRQRGTDRVAINFIGDGATSVGDFHESLNLAAVMKLPFVLIIENNQFAFSTPLHQQFATHCLACRATGYGMPGYPVDGNDAEEMYRVISRAVARARRGEGPTLIEARVGRLRGHSQGDDSFTHVPPELAEWSAQEEPLAKFEARLLERGLCDSNHLQRVEGACRELLIEISDEALAAPDPDPEVRRAVHAGD